MNDITPVAFDLFEELAFKKLDEKLAKMSVDELVALGKESRELAKLCGPFDPAYQYLNESGTTYLRAAYLLEMHYARPLKSVERLNFLGLRKSMLGVVEIGPVEFTLGIPLYLNSKKEKDHYIESTFRRRVVGANGRFLGGEVEIIEV